MSGLGSILPPLGVRILLGSHTLGCQSRGEGAWPASDFPGHACCWRNSASQRLATIGLTKAAGAQAKTRGQIRYQADNLSCFIGARQNFYCRNAALVQLNLCATSDFLSAAATLLHHQASPSSHPPTPDVPPSAAVRRTAGVPIYGHRPREVS